ncbi:MAG: hypothetical protein R3C17_08875 [Planctomycetaceae bacterium]
MNSKTDTISDLLQPRARLAQLARGDTRRTDEESATATDEYTAFARGRVGTRPQMMICFRKCSGEVTVFAYSMLTRIQSDNTNRGFTITFGDTKVCIEGENLTPLFHYVREHRAVEILETERTVFLTAEGDCLVSRVSVVLPK